MMKKSLNNHQLKRNEGRRGKVRKKILIVCEGKETEVNYFNGMKSCLKLTNVSIEVAKTDDAGSLKSILPTAERLDKEEKRKTSYEFDEVYCVFDYDNREEQFNELCYKINNIKKYQKYCAIASYPCFEYWLLCHFKDTTKPFLNADECFDALEQELPNYKKNLTNLYQELGEKKRETAKENAKKREEENNKNPSTNVYKLVEALEKLKR